MSTETEAVYSHLESFFEGHPVSRLDDLPGLERTLVRVPSFSIAVVAPGPKSPHWIYATLGCWDSVHTDDGHGLEFFMVAPENDFRHCLTLAMTAHYHAGATDHRLDFGHTVPLGEPWLDGSACDHLLVTLPYIFGPRLETCEFAGGHARILWLLPIAEAERDFKAEHGLDALEQRFEEGDLEYWNGDRGPLV
jgi:hypothetical protein